jgi:hypothetical protein
MFEAQIQVEQLDSWERAMEEGRGLFQEALALQAEAEQAQELRHWDDAASKFRQSRTVYAAALARLNVPAAIDITSYRALNLLREDAQKLLQQARDAVEEHDRTRWAEMCERNMSMALDFLQQSRIALEEQNFGTARLLASQASEMDPALQAEAERTIRASGEYEAEDQQRATRRWVISSAIIGALVLVLLLGGFLLWDTIIRIFS